VRGPKENGERRGSRKRLVYACLLAVLVAAAAGAIAAVTLSTSGSDGPSWAPSVRDNGGLRTIATATSAGYTLFTAHGPVRFLPGMDLGATTPGHQPGELAITAADDTRWLAEMGALGVRAVRIYTVHPPAFYQALAAYNTSHATDPIYLIQGVYLPNDDYLNKQNMYDPAATQTFRQELRDAAAAVHGTLVRPFRIKPGADALRQAFNTVSAP
jgi:hypothetical protein